MKTVEEMFEVSGYFELLSVQIGDTVKAIGTRKIENPQPSRPLGVYGQREYVFTEPLVLTAGHKQVVIKASAKKPLHCFGIANALCGRAK